MSDNDEPLYGRSPAMNALDAMREYNALPLNSPVRRAVVLMGMLDIAEEEANDFGE